MLPEPDQDAKHSRLSLSRKGAVLQVCLDNPPINLVDRQMIRELRSLLASLQNDSDIHVVVFRSANPEFFISHADLSHYKEGLAATSMRPQKLTSLQELLEGYRKLGKATIAVIEGKTNGIGTELALSMDMRFADVKAASIGVFEVALGCLPGGTGTQRLLSAAGRARALELILGCDEINAQQAVEYGLLNRAMEKAALWPFVDRLSARIASFPLNAIALAKQAIDFNVGDIHAQLVNETMLAGELLSQAEAPRRIQKFLASGGQEIAFERRLSEHLPGLADD